MSDDPAEKHSTFKRNSNILSKIFGHDFYDDVSEETVITLLQICCDKGIMEHSAKNMIENIFRFDDTIASDIMTHRKDMIAVEDTTPLKDVVDIVINTGYSRIPVYHEDTDNITGILYAKDLLTYIYNDIPKNFKLTDITRDVFYIPGSKNCNELFADMTSNKIQLAIVVDEYGGTGGLISLEDIIEAIVGNIQDEYDNEEEDVRKLSDKIYAVDGSASLDEVSDLVGVSFEDEESDTLAGLMLEHLGKIPLENERPTIVIKGVKFTAARIEKRRIARVLIELDKPTE